MSGMTWLHLSDWHQKGPGFDRQVTRDALIEDIRERTERIDSALAQVDFVVFSGDLAFSGKPADYEAARKHLLDPVLEAVNLKPDRLFIVPGNHDLSRDTVYEMLPSELQEPLDSDALVQKWLTDAKKRTRALEPFEAYREFVTGYTGQTSPDYASILRLEAGGKRIALLGLNSAWMCGRNKDARGEIYDYGYTLVGEPQIYDALAQIADADVRIAVLHHPCDWLAEFDRNRIEARLGRECHFILRGHEHKPQVSIVRGTEGDCVIIPAGASYKRCMAEDLHYANVYNFVHLDSDAGQGEVYLRRWSAQRNEWIEDTDSSPGGPYYFFLPKGLGEHPVQPAVSPAVLEAGARRRRAAELHYREILLETCDIISLANLPEQDRHLAQRQLELRRLYVPLRVWVEARAGEPTGEPGKEGELWEALEQRRAAALRSRAQVERERRERIPVGERLAQARRLVVLGDPGAGKTTLTRWIATAYLLRLKNDPDWQALPDVQTLPAAGWLPIIVRCRDLAKDPTCLSGSLDDILKYTLRRAELSEVEAADLCAMLRARLEAGQALLMLDGLDEITDPQARAIFCQQVEQMVVAYPNAPVIATSRIVGYREMGYKLGQGFEHLTLADLTREEKEDFAHRWCALTELPERRAAAAEELIHDIHSAERIERLTGNPMLLTTMALVKRKVGKLPSRRADLYWEAVQVLLNWRREVDEPLDWREAIPQLEYLAYAMCDRGVQQVRQDEVLDLFARMREEYPSVHAARNRPPEEFLKRLEARTGILVEAGHVRHLGMLMPVYEFRHLTFQEYLAARALVDGRFPGRDPQRSLAEQVAPLAGRTVDMAFTEGGPQEATVVENWREALRLCTAICSDDDVGDVLLAILTPQESEPPPTARARAILAALCLADEPNADDRAARQALRAFAAQVGEDDGGGRVRTGLDAAAMELANTRWAETLRGALVDEFCQRGGRRRENPGGLVGMVGAAGAPQDSAGLADWLAKQARWLQSREESEAIKAALAVGQLVTPWESRRALQEAQLPSGLGEALITRLAGSAPLAHAAAWALHWLNNSRYGPRIWKPTASEIDRFIAVVINGNSDAGVVANLARILGQEKVIVVVAPLIARLEDAEADVRCAAAEALGGIKSEAAVAPLITRLEDAEANVRCAAAEALGEIMSEAAVAPLITRLGDAEANVRRAAAEALGEIRSEVAVAPLITRLEDAEANVRSAAAMALGGIKSEAAVVPLIACLEDADQWVRSVAAGALGEIKSEAAVAPLIARLEDTEANVRFAAAYALGQIGSEVAVASLIERLEDAEWMAQSAAAEGLGRILRNQGRLEEAEIAYRRAIELDQKLAWPHTELGALYELADRLEDALCEHQQAVHLDPAMGMCHGSLASVLRKLGHLEDAEAHLARARALLPRDDDYNRACLEAIAGNAEAALEHLARAREQGFGDRTWAARDPDLASLHGDPRFEMLVGCAPGPGARGTKRYRIAL